MAAIHIDVVSTEHEILSGNAKSATLPGEAGKLGILSGYTPLIMRIKPDAVCIERKGGSEELVFVAGDILGMRLKKATVLANTIIRGHGLDGTKANETRRTAEEASQSQSSDLGLARMQGGLAVVAAQLAAIARLRRKR